ncbi:MAG: prefoldin subunit alpha [Nanoarchaeota archaeon]|nr:prefoldin subunit alpha [Nanoarchaeota archaeon]
MVNEELIYKLSLLEQQAQQIQQQLQMIEQGIAELITMNLSINHLQGSVGKEILAPFGRGIFVKAKLLDENLTVDIGGKNFVKKTIPETKELIKEQIGKLEEAKASLIESLEEMNQEATSMISNIQRESGEIKEEEED